MGAESPKLAKYGQEVDYYEPKRGDKHQGKITKVSGFGYEITDDKTGKKFKFKFYDPKKAKKLMQTESAASDARRAMKKDPDMKQRAFSKDVSATDDDEKAASKNIIMQMRKAVSLKGRFDVEFQDGKKVKIPTKIAQEVQRKFNSLRRPQDKQKFQAKVAKSHKSMLAALRESFESSPRKLVEGTWALPDSPSKKNELKNLMKKKIKLGKEGDDASDALGGLVGDDSLMDDLYTAGKKNPNGDARPIIKKHMKRLGIKEDLDEAKERQISHDEFMKKGGYKNNSQFSTGAGKYKKYYTHAKEEVELDEMFDYVLIDKDNKIAGRYSGKDAKKNAESGKRSAHLPPMRIPKNEVGKMKIVPISPKDKKGIGDTVLAIGEDLDEAKFGDKKALAKKGAEISRVQAILKGKQKPYKKDHKKEELDSEDKPQIKKIVKKLKGASDAHAGQADELEKAMSEGRMKELHSLIQQGKSAKEIAKTMKLDVKTIKALMNSYEPTGDMIEGAAVDALLEKRKLRILVE